MVEYDSPEENVMQGKNLFNFKIKNVILSVCFKTSKIMSVTNFKAFNIFLTNINYTS